MADEASGATAVSNPQHFNRMDYEVLAELDRGAQRLADIARPHLTLDMVGVLLSGKFDERLKYEFEVMFKRIELLPSR